ncbi:MAG: dihydrofolate reductase [Oligoflexales bacterium]
MAVGTSLAACTLFESKSSISQQEQTKEFQYLSENFADLRILRYRNPDFADLNLSQKKLSYFLSMAALSGRDIIWDQNYKHNLSIRRTLENIVKTYEGERSSEAFKKFMIYVKRVWFSNGIHHHYSTDKFVPEIDQGYLKNLILGSDLESFPIQDGEDLASFIDRMSPLILDESLDAKKVNQSQTEDLVETSAVNFYAGLTQVEVEEFYRSLIEANPDDVTPISYGLNSKLIKENGEIKELVYKVGGMYDKAITQVVYWLKQAVTVSETDLQRQSLEKLIEYYETGDLEKFDAYNILWVQDVEPQVDAINGFIEVYNDPLGKTGSWESVVSTKDLESTKKFGVLSDSAAWFEEHSPIDPAHKRDEVTGVSYKIINVVMESGDSSPATPIGINLPNANWIRANHGSKSVSLGNIEQAYEEAAKSSGVLEEFFLPEHIDIVRKYGSIADRLSTGLHEVIGHASGKILDGVGTPSETLKQYASTLEEARADLVALYYIGDEYLEQIGVTEKNGEIAKASDVMKAEYIQYITNGLMKQLARIDEGDVIEESHMRNRQLISSWALEQGKADNVIEIVKMKDKTYFTINDYNKLREIFGELLKEVQRVKSVGDFDAGQALVENYGVKIDPELHKEVLDRWGKLNQAPYSGFINPQLHPVFDENKEIIDITISYPENFKNQMLYYAKEFSFLSNYN